MTTTQELIAELDRIAKEGYADYNNTGYPNSDAIKAGADALEALQAENTALRMHWETRANFDALQAEIERLRKDAERYRWLRNRPEDPDIYIGVDSPKHPNRWALIGEYADSVIDAEIAKEQAPCTPN